MAHGWLLDEEPDIKGLEKMVRMSQTSVSIIFDFVIHISQLCLGVERVHGAASSTMTSPDLDELQDHNRLARLADLEKFIIWYEYVGPRRRAGEGGKKSKKEKKSNE